MTKKESESPKQVEDGITPTVQTIFSKITVGDIINSIADLKAQTLLSWLDNKGITPQKTLIIGTYLTGARIANYLIKSSSVTVVDIYPHLKTFLDSDISFKKSIYELDAEKFDLIIDTTGLGGLKKDEMNHLIKHLATDFIFLAENPTSDGSDQTIKSLNKTQNRLEFFKNIDYPNTIYQAYLSTEGLNSKTSGTMTMTMDVLRYSMIDALQKEGVLYAVSSLDFYERILFKEKDMDKFLKSLKRPAMTISSLKTIDCEQIIQKNMDKINSNVITY